MRRRYIFDIIAGIGCIAIIALGIEAYVRFSADDGMQYDLEMWKYARDIKEISSDPLIGHEHAPNRNAKLMGVAFSTNSRGLRDREFPYERGSKKLRILMLGDSLTVGWGVPLEATFSKRIERLYADNGIDADVINTGVGNYNTVQEVQYFLNEGYKYKPDIVVLNFFVNDAEPILPHHQPTLVARNCYACIFIAGRLDTVTRKFSGSGDWASYYLGLYNDGRAEGWLMAQDYIRRLAEFCKANGVELLVASLPELHDVTNYRFQNITDMVHKAARQNGVAFIDILPYVKNRPSPELWVTAPDPHPNELAHGLIAQGLFDALRELDHQH
jgi:lysophospholipase L1-like esterase